MHLICGNPKGDAVYGLSVLCFTSSKKGFFKCFCVFVKTFEWQEWERIHTNLPSYTIQHYIFYRPSKILDYVIKHTFVLHYAVILCIQVCFVLLFSNHENANFRPIFGTQENCWVTIYTSSLGASSTALLGNCWQRNTL